jgi:UDP-N-acetylmuramoylalanine--D-glutamate ligase
LAATCAVLPFGINSETILKVVSTFRGVEHRLEPVREINGVRYFNDSIASSPTRTISGLNSFQEPIILIAGGYDKNLSFTELAEVILNKVKSLILIGDTAHKIQQVVEEAMERKEKDIPIIRSSNLKDAVDAATDQAHAGDVVLLSPACASFDMFKDFEERGQRFKELVMAIK